MNESNVEKLARIKQGFELALGIYGNHKGRSIYAPVQEISDMEFLIEQAERAQMLEEHNLTYFDMHGRLRKENARLREALEFYAKKDNYYLPPPGTDVVDYYVAMNTIADDCGKLARAALDDNT